MEADECRGFYSHVHVQGSLDERDRALPLADGLEILCSAKNQLFHLGSSLGKNFDSG